MLFCLIGPSGAGKSFLLDAILEAMEIENPVSHTTRTPRDGEEDGVHYHFVTDAEFESLLIRNKMAEHTVYGEHYYGLSVEELEKGGDKIVIVETDGFTQLARNLGRTNVRLIHISAPGPARVRRMVKSRATKEETLVPDLKRIISRLELDKEHFKDISTYGVDKLIENPTDDIAALGSTLVELFSYLEKEGVPIKDRPLSSDDIIECTIHKAKWVVKKRRAQNED